MTNVRMAIAISMCVIVALTGCAKDAPVVPADAPPVSTPTAGTVPPVDYSTTPDQLFDADCAALFTSAEVETVMGSAMPASTSPFTFPVIQSAGLECTWGSDEIGTDGSVLNVVVLPAVTVPTAVDGQTCIVDNNGPGAFGWCVFTALSHGLVLSGTVSIAVGSTKADAEAALRRLLPVFESRAANAASPDIREPSADAWPATVDCERLEELAGIRALLGGPTMKLYQGDIDGYFKPAIALLGAGHDWSECSWQDYVGSSSGNDFVGATIFADGLWAKDRLAAGGVSTKVAGADEAFRVTMDGGEGPSEIIVVVVGNNVMTVAPAWQPLDGILPTVPVLITALNAM